MRVTLNPPVGVEQQMAVPVKKWLTAEVQELGGSAIVEKDTGEPRGMQPLTVAGRRVEVLHGPTVVAAFHEATLPSGEVHGHLIG